MVARKQRKPHVADNFGVTAALNGDVQGVYVFMNFVETQTSNMSFFGAPLPPVITARLHSMAKEARALKEYCDGYVAGTKLR